MWTFWRSEKYLACGEFNPRPFSLLPAVCTDFAILAA